MDAAWSREASPAVQLNCSLCVQSFCQKILVILGFQPRAARLNIVFSDMHQLIRGIEFRIIWEQSKVKDVNVTGRLDLGIILATFQAVKYIIAEVG